MITAALVLAAGGSSRLGHAKQLVDVDGRPMLERVIADVWTWPVDEVVVVLGASVEDILEAVDLGPSTVVENPEWEEGLASSLRVGLDLLTRGRTERVFIVLGDEPSIPTDVPEALVEAMDAGSAPVAAPKYRYQRGTPLLVDRSLWPRLMSLEGDPEPARLFDAHSEWVADVRVDHLPPRDVDTEADVSDLRGPRRRN
ncbi:MAG TPA: nucleotidyltransferase family protein [Acidimicrobiia bacterium]|nr:nucleotidyltransferase family protein [Acidimicrobiia bacterium]